MLIAASIFLPVGGPLVSERDIIEAMGGASSRLVSLSAAIPLVAAFVAALAGCDSRAKASDPAGARAEARSREYESCGSSLHCQDDLRCFDNVCRRTARSNVGDFFAALGALHEKKGELEAALQAYNRALGHYDTEKLAVPPDVDCAYGGALAAARAKKEHAELAARVLHRCVLAVPVGSTLRERALAQLALVNEAGLEPLTLGRTQLADVYLTRAPQKPASDKLKVTVTAMPAITKKTFPLIPERLAEPDLRPALVACWEAYNQATRKAALATVIGVKWSYIPSDYDDEPGRYVSKIEPPAAAPAGPDANAARCVHAAVEPALQALSSVRDTFTTKLTITIK